MKVVVDIDYWPSQPQAPCFLKLEETRMKGHMNVRVEGKEQDPIFYIKLNPAISKEANEGLTALLRVLEPGNGGSAYEGLCLVLEAVFFAGLEFGAKYPPSISD